MTKKKRPIGEDEKKWAYLASRLALVDLQPVHRRWIPVLRESLVCLTTRERQVVEMFLLKEKSADTVAEELGICVSRVYQLEKRALWRLGHYLYSAKRLDWKWNRNPDFWDERYVPEYVLYIRRGKQIGFDPSFLKV